MGAEKESWTVMKSGVQAFRRSGVRAFRGSGVQASGPYAQGPRSGPQRQNARRPVVILLAGLLALCGPIAIAQRRPGRDAPPAFPEDRTNYRFRAQLDTSPKIDAERA